MMKNYENQNENLALISKIDKIDNRKHMSLSPAKLINSDTQIMNSSFNNINNTTISTKNLSKMVNLHNFTDYQVAQINQNNKLMADKLDRTESEIKNFYNPNDVKNQKYLSKQISRHNKKHKLLKTMTNLTKSQSDVYKNAQNAFKHELLRQIMY